MQDEKTIKVFITGGTIAKRYDELSGKLVFDSTHFEKMLLQGRNKAEVTVETLMLKDSLEMTEDDRNHILKVTTNTPSNHILITHGTDTMVQTAKALASIKGKTIVLVGAMIPYAFKNSDALFNVGCALGAVSILGEGVFIVMNGKIFNWDAVVKDTQQGIFVEIKR